MQYHREQIVSDLDDKSFAYRLRKAFEEIWKSYWYGGFNQSSIAEELGIAEQTLSYYLKSKRVPNINMFLEIVDYCKKNIKNFNAEYLLGLSPNMTKDNSNFNNFFGFDDNNDVGFDNEVIAKLKEIKEKDLIPSFSKFLKASNFMSFIEEFDNEVKAHEQWLLERQMRISINENTSKK